MEWENWLSILLIAVLLLCCGAMMAMGRKHDSKNDNNKEQS